MTAWVPLFQVKPLLDNGAVEAIRAVIKCRRVVQVVRSPDEGHKGLWLCARVPLPKTVAAEVDATRTEGEAP